jgi:hypothetical protein
MALTKGVNSHVSLAEADAYFEVRLDVAAWNAASDDRKEQALITATSMLEDMNWTGVVMSESQSLAFPRSGTYFDPRLGYYVTLDNDVPDRIIKATYETAYHLLNNDGVLDETGNVTDITIGPIELTRVRRPSQMPSTAKRLMKPLLMNAGSNSWWRAN